MDQDMFRCKCIHDTLDGLQAGLSLYSHPGRTALIYAVSPQDPMRVCDPQSLLNGHEPKFEELYIENDAWRQAAPDFKRMTAYGHIFPEDNLELAGLISQGGRSSSLFYQMWFTEHHPDMCSIGPTERWLEHAAWRLSHDFASQMEAYTGISGYFLREYALHAVRDHILDEMNRLLGWDAHLRIYPVLDAVLAISKTPEEGAWPRGELTFVEPRSIPKIDFIAKFPTAERPRIDSHKHVRKLLIAVEGSAHQLVSDGIHIVGISQGTVTPFHVTADFRARHGFLKINEAWVCSFFDGNFHSSTRQAKLVQVEEALLETHLDHDLQTTLFQSINQLVHAAEKQKHGCTLVIDLNQTPVSISGQKLEHPLDLQNEDQRVLAQSLSKMDGALHIGSDLRLHGFACLLDGQSIEGEDRSRGARFNSALRFTARHPNILVVVVSSDRPVSVIQEGVELNALCHWNPDPQCFIQPPTLAEWIAADKFNGS